MSTIRLFGELDETIADAFLAADRTVVEPTEFLRQESPTEKSAIQVEKIEDLALYDSTEQELEASPEQLIELEKYASAQIEKRSVSLGLVAKSALSVDFPLSPMEWTPGQHWQVSPGAGQAYGDRFMAEQLLRRNAAQLPSDGADVGVIILDVGLNRDYINAIAGPGHFGGGWQRRIVDPHGSPQQVGQFTDPHARACDGHGNMIARNVLSLAPAATIYDAPILPDRVTNIRGFASNAARILHAIKRLITNPAGNPDLPQHQHWILINAWAVATRFADAPGQFSYVANREHRLNARFIELAMLDNVDVVFAAGNAGQFQPAFQTGPYDRDPGRAIWGANGLEEVFTIGAVRADRLAIGASSQGPSYPELMTAGHGLNQKPDMACPSWFTEARDPSINNTGTSASCALFGGYLAAYRGAFAGTPSQDVKAEMIAAEQAHRNWHVQTGYGLPFLNDAVFTGATV